ncbi:efflux RND transporter periplasmic adaptor subunit [Rhodanobacter sp. C01]|uniref:efflux RND transporter periplasmic adaptor subunit n=1 Tax=Rhodanobacter sp. C01 TaxID=1945856 RepID=UPI0009861DBC|nr:efflux RND transporter periplasmic adaptor subunit [Rhodanobacter sp. C01]OOG47756.1 efflux transporter periplasmic adaptor subunit [Rhodanobacter sp. C01]
MPLKKLLLVVVVLGLSALSVSWYRHHHESAGKHAATAAVVPVKVATATQGDVDVSLRQIGSVEAYSTVTVSSQVDGQIQSLAFVPGAHVRKGDLLARIDPRPLQAQLDQAIGNVARDEANLVKAKADLGRYSPLLAQGYVAQSDIDTYKANLGVAQAALQSDRAARELAQTQLNYTRIVAPFDGVLGAPLVYPGAVVTANSTGIVVLNQIEPVRVTFALPQDSLPAVRQAQARGAISVQAQPDGAGSKPINGTLEFINNAVDTTTSTITLKARFDNKDDQLIPGQFVNVTLPTARIANAVSVPVIALQNSSTGTFVFVYKPDGTIKQRPVTVGTTTVERTVIDKGVAAGEQVVVEGQMLLVDGSHARISAN